MQRILEATGMIFEQTPEGGVVKMRRFRAGDLIRLRPQSRLHTHVKSEIGKVVEVEPHPPQTGPTYRVWAAFPGSDRLNGIFSFEFELVKAAPEWSSTADLAAFQVLREGTGDFDGVIVHCFDGQKLVIALIQRAALEDSLSFGLERRPTSKQCADVAEANISILSDLIKAKYFSGDYRMLDRYGSTYPFVEVSYGDIQAGGKALHMPSVQHSWG
jgi:hypothetical protein